MIFIQQIQINLINRWVFLISQLSLFWNNVVKDFLDQTVAFSPFQSQVKLQNAPGRVFTQQKVETDIFFNKI